MGLRSGAKAVWLEKWGCGRPGAGEGELYLWRTDPAETRDRARDLPDRVGELREVLSAMEQRMAAIQAEEVELTDERMSELEALGYIDRSGD